MSSPSPQQERRRAPRAHGDFPIRLSQDPDAPPAALRDISEIGLACTSPLEIPEMTLIGLDFALPGQTDQHSVKGAVVRCESQKDGSWDLAVYFTEMQPTTRAALSNFVAKGKPA